jgi:hypothetical protein
LRKSYPKPSLVTRSTSLAWVAALAHCRDGGRATSSASRVGSLERPTAARMDQGGNDDSLGYGIKLVTLKASVNRSFVDTRVFPFQTGLSFT